MQAALRGTNDSPGGFSVLLVAEIPKSLSGHLLAGQINFASLIRPLLFTLQFSCLRPPAANDHSENWWKRSGRELTS
jgi:hypothetical protein